MQQLKSGCKIINKNNITFFFIYFKLRVYLNNLENFY